MDKTPVKLGEILIKENMLTQEQLDIALEIQRKEGGLIGGILVKHGFIKSEAIINVFVQYLDHLYVEHKLSLKSKILFIAISAFFALTLLYYLDNQPLLKNINHKLYSWLLNVEYTFRGPPAAIRDVVIVAIDNETVSNMPYRWPYPRSNFATVIENLKKAKPRVIGIDFAYLGKSTPPDDILLNKAFNWPHLILASSINEDGRLNASYFSNNTNTYGIVTKLQDDDGIIRRDLIYLINKEKPKEAFLSWEMQVLKAVKAIDVHSMADAGERISFKNNDNEQWSVPVDKAAKSFLIHFRSHTKDFQRISFYNVFNGDFDPNLIKDKIVLIGVLPALFQDIQNTSVGFLPGVILNANAFLTLYTHEFLKEVPLLPEKIIIIIAVILTSLSMFSLKKRTSLLILIQITVFFLISYVSLISGYVLNYLDLPCAIILCPFLSKKILSKLKFL